MDLSVSTDLSFIASLNFMNTQLYRTNETNDFDLVPARFPSEDSIDYVVRFIRNWFFDEDETVTEKTVSVTGAVVKIRVTTKLKDRDIEGPLVVGSISELESFD